MADPTSMKHSVSSLKRNLESYNVPSMILLLNDLYTIVNTSNTYPDSYDQQLEFTDDNFSCTIRIRGSSVLNSLQTVKDNILSFKVIMLRKNDGLFKDFEFSKKALYLKVPQDGGWHVLLLGIPCWCVFEKLHGMR